MLRLTILLVIPLLAAADPDPVKVRLDTALDTWRAEMKAFRDKGMVLLEAREKAARKNGDKKVVDRIKEEQTAFARTDELPKGAEDLKDLKVRATESRAKLVKAYTAAIKDWTKAGNDTAAGAAERDLAWVKIGVDPNERRRVWIEAKGEHEYRLVSRGVWDQTLPNGSTTRFNETARTTDYVEIVAVVGTTRYVARLTQTTADYKEGSASEFKTVLTGHWKE